MSPIPITPELTAEIHRRLSEINGASAMALGAMAPADLRVTVKMTHLWLADRTSRGETAVPAGVESALLKLYDRLQPPPSRILDETARITRLLDGEAATLKATRRAWPQMAAAERLDALTGLVDRFGAAMWAGVPNPSRIDVVAVESPVIKTADGWDTQMVAGVSFQGIEDGRPRCRLEINTLAGPFGDFVHMLGTLAHELTHAGQKWTYFEAAAGRITPDHPDYGLADLWGDNFKHYRRESKDLYHNQPVERHAFAVGNAVKQHLARLLPAAPLPAPQTTPLRRL